MADTNFYRVFEDRHRGSRELIKSRLAVYLPFILPLKHYFANCLGVDLGCGRGEWLELMRENGIDVQGIDIDKGMLDAARERGLKAKQGDAIEYLQSLASESEVIISGFHLAEHLPFDILQDLIRESFRVLKPGGLLILETPNPENIVVGTADFYLDPTHQRPIPLLLLSFLVEYSGFDKIKILRLHESPSLANNYALTLLNVLNGVSPDYAVVAQKGGPPELFAAMAPAFNVEYGLSLDNLANNYDQQIKARTHQAEAKAHQAEIKAAEQEQRFIASQEHVLDLLNSTSWRITTPLRMVSHATKSAFHLLNMAKLKIKKKGKLLLVHAKLYIDRRPRLRRTTLVLLKPFPALRGILNQTVAASSSVQAPPVLVEKLTPRASYILGILVAAIERRAETENKGVQVKTKYQSHNQERQS